MEIRVLTADEATKAQAMDGISMPESTLFIGAINDEGEIVGRTTLVSLLHIEGTRVEEHYRGTTLAARLVRAAEAKLKELGATYAIAYTPDYDPKIGEYLERFGYTRLPVTPWQKSLTNGD